MRGRCAPRALSAPGSCASSSSEMEPVAKIRQTGDVTAVPRLSAGPYDAEDVRAAAAADGAGTRRNTIRFTPVQVGAIVDAMRPGLSLIVGPPGTGKTDVAVQILNLLYHENAESAGGAAARTLLITHSNSALNDIFEKISLCDVPSTYLLRAGMGERDLNTRHDYSREGRIDYYLQRRLNLLAEVERLARSMAECGGDATCASGAAA